MSVVSVFVAVQRCRMCVLYICIKNALCTVCTVLQRCIRMTKPCIQVQVCVFEFTQWHSMLNAYNYHRGTYFVTHYFLWKPPESHTAKFSYIVSIFVVRIAHKMYHIRWPYWDLAMRNERKIYTIMHGLQNSLSHLISLDVGVQYSVVGWHGIASVT